MRSSFTATVVIVLLGSTIPTGLCSQAHQKKVSGTATGDTLFDEAFYDTFDDMDKQDRVIGKIDEGFANWEERCLKIGGQSALDAWLKAQENLVFCVLQNFDTGKMQREMEEKKKTGDLDLVFKKYCEQPVQKTRPCIQDFLEVSRRCLRSHDRAGLNVTLGMIDAAIDFICHNNGDRLALFMSEEGLACMESHQEPIMACINMSVPELFHMNNHKNIDLIVFNQQNCRKGDAIRQCIEDELLQCNDPTPSNVVNSMLLAMREATPCQGIYSRLSSSSPKSTLHSGVLLLSMLLLWSTFS